MPNNIPSFLLVKPASTLCSRGRGNVNISFIEKTLHRLTDVVKTGYAQWETASQDKFFHKVDGRVKVIFLLVFIVIVSLKQDIFSEVLITAFVFALAVLARLDFVGFLRRVLFFSFLFGFLVALPSALNIVIRGEIIFPLWHFSRPYSFWVYHIPQEIGFTREGLEGVALLTLRVANSLALSFFILCTTSFPDIIKALKVLKVPDCFLMIITLSYKYIFIFARTAEDIHLAKKSRMVRQAGNAEERRWVAGRIAFIFKKTRLRCEEIYGAMLSRGFSEDVRIYGARKFHALDWAVSLAFLVAGVIFLWI